MGNYLALPKSAHWPCIRFFTLSVFFLAQMSCDGISLVAIVVVNDRVVFGFHAL